MFLILRLSTLRLTEGTGSDNFPCQIASIDKVPELKTFSFNNDTCPAAATSALIKSLSAVRCKSVSALFDIVP